MRIQNRIRRIANVFGIDVLRLHESPQGTVLGLRSRNVGSIIDCGANEGQFARDMSSVFPQAQMYCFEPLKGPFHALSAWAETQHGRVHCINVALGDEEGEVEIHRHDAHTPSSSLLPSTARTHELYPQTVAQSLAKVRLTTLDRALEKHMVNMPRDILLKLDVQGFEDRVLRGAAAVLRECSACILEVNLEPLYEGQADFFELAHLMRDAGFGYSGNLHQTYSKEGRVVFVDAVFSRPQ
ncbi:MAG: FkbM family methyltransferase [Polyangiaceae bacterium]|nr:FkbM family methyltransferase [Polyangiaceae bacterium]